MAKSGIESVAACYELERFHWKTFPTGKSEVKCRCPVHEDSNPSVSLNIEKNVWHCHVCKAKGDIISLVAHVAKTSRAAVLQEFSNRYDLEDEKEFPADTVETFHQFFLKTIEIGNPMFGELNKRGVTMEMIRSARIGFYDGRITIPVYDHQGRIVNVRRYMPGAREKKMLNTTGFSKVRLYQINDTDKPIVWICGGELKALVVKHILNGKGIGAVSVTAGEGAWDSSWNTLFKGKQVYICMDIDPAGQSASRKLAELLYSSCRELFVITLPLDRVKYPKGDVSDYVGQEGAGEKELLDLMVSAKRYEPITVSVEIDKGTKEVTLNNVADPSNVDHRLVFTGIVTALDTTPFLVPKEVWCYCTRDQAGCGTCPIKREDPDDSGFVKKVISPTAKGLLDMVNIPTIHQHLGIKSALGIPKCSSVQFDVKDHYSILDARLSPQLEVSNDASGIQQPAFMLSPNVELNVPYIFSGKVYPHPKTQQAVLLVNDMVETADSLAKYSLTPADRELLKVFSCTPTVERIEEKLSQIYDDLEDNVTRIFSRRDLHLLVDLTYHSALHIFCDGRVINGWLNTLVCGDSAQGKSETTIRLKNHYGLGERIECKNASVAGLVGGLQQLQGRWFVTWGVVPTNDRRLVILEEVKGASTEILSKLTDMRSSGVAEIPKIERRRAHARTRLLFISNPREAQPISAFNFGVEALQNLIGALEDIRRFDAALVMSSEDLDVTKLAPKNNIPHRFTAELCHKLVLFAWTLKHTDIKVHPEAELALTDAAVYFSGRYTDAFPLVDKGTCKHKLLRLATALAIRLYSVNSENQLVVLPGHVQYIREWLDRNYSSPKFGYLEFTRAQEFLNAIPDAKKIGSFIKATKHPRSMIDGFLMHAELTLLDMMDFAEVDRDAGQNLLSYFVRSHCLRRNGRQGYQKTPAFIQLLKTLQNTVKEVDLTDTDM